MAIQKFESRFNIKALIVYALSLLFMVISYIIYTALPESDSFTNSIEVTGEQTVKAFIAAPLSALVSVVIFIIFAVVFRKYFLDLALIDNRFGDKIISDTFIKATSYAVAALLLIFSLISTCFTFVLFFDFYELGFVAPIADTVYESNGNFILVSCIIHGVFLVLTTIKMLGVSIVDSIGKLIVNKEKKS